jgi:hypothetical protein
MVRESKVLAHLESGCVSIYRLDGRQLTLIDERSTSFDERLPLHGLADAVVELRDGLKDFIDVVDNEVTRLYATGPFQRLSRAEAAGLTNTVFVDTGLYLNIVQPELEQFYRQSGGSEGEPGDMMLGMTRQELRKVVVCGSFQQSLGDIEAVSARLREAGAEVLSPASTRIKPDTEGTDFILFDYQDFLKNERDTWRHKYDHMQAFRQADAVVVCNPGGRIGKGTLFELGFMAAIAQRVILTEEPVGVSILFPCQVGLDV